ncbi:MAG: metallophosphoesterase [Flavobacteriales bacterium]
MFKYSLSLILLTVSIISNCQTVIRGPYLQMPTHESIVVMWRTSSATQSRVVFGTNPSNLNLVATSGGNNTDHKVILTGLQPFTRYYYAVGNTGNILGGGTLQHTFLTHPVPGTEMPIRIWSIGDFGKGNAGQIDVKNAYLNYADTGITNVWLWLGDNVYNDGKDSEYQSKVFGYTGFNDLFSWMPFYPTPGNHDYNEIWDESTFLGIPYSNIPLTSHQGPYYDIVEVPKQAEAGGHPSNLEVFYSFDYGNVHFLSLNSEIWDLGNTLTAINQMKNWITQDLQQNTKLFTVAFFHQPPYSKGSHDSDSGIELVMKCMREEIIPLLESYDVDLIVCGHSHVYERSYLIKGHYGNSSSFNPAQHLVNGTSGNIQNNTPYIKDSLPTSDGSLYVVCGNSGSSESGASLNHPVFFYSEGSSYGSFVMEVYKNRLDGKYLASNGNINDQFTLLKKNMILNPIANQTICQGDIISVQATTQGGSDHIGFSWTGSSSTSQSASFSPATSGIFFVTAMDSLTGQHITQSFSIQVFAPDLSLDIINDTLFAESGYTYQWMLNGTPIAGANQNYLVPVVNGNYSVVISQGACVEVSNVFPINGLSDSSSDFLPGISIFPNPGNGLFILKCTSSEPIDFVVVDGRGRKIRDGRISNTPYQINISNEENGIYFLILKSGQKSTSRILTLQK